MISKELLSEVLEKDIKHYTIRDKNIVCSSQSSVYIDANIVEKPINIYELAHKCKEWAVKQGYGISIHTNDIIGYKIVLNRGFEIVEIYAKLETEAIFNACELILKQK